MLSLCARWDVPKPTLGQIRKECVLYVVYSNSHGPITPHLPMSPVNFVSTRGAFACVQSQQCLPQGVSISVSTTGSLPHEKMCIISKYCMCEEKALLRSSCTLLSEADTPSSRSTKCGRLVRVTRKSSETISHSVERGLSTMLSIAYPLPPQAKLQELHHGSYRGGLKP